MLEGLFINILSALLYELTKAGFKQLLTGTPTSEAIRLTANDFPSLKHVKSALTIWCKSDDFIEELERLSGSIDETQVGLITDSFISIGKFYDNIHILDTRRTAQEVLSTFFKYLEIELYKTEYAAYIETTRAKLRIQAARSDIQKLSQQSQEQTEEIKTHIDESFKQYLKPIEIESSPEFQEKLHFAAIDLAVQLLREGKMETARARLTELRDKIGDENDSVNLRFRLTANIGICYFHLDDLDSARAEFERAVALKPDHKLILSHLALVLSLKGNSEGAVDYALRSRSTDEEHKSVITANYIRVMHRANRTDEIKTLLETEDWVESDPNCAISLGVIKFGEKDYEQSEIYFRAAREGDPQNAHTLRLLAQTIIVPIDQIILNNPPVILPEEYGKRLSEAEDYLTDAIRIFDRYENKTPLFEALLQRAYVRGLLGNDSESLTDCEWMLRISPGDDEALRQKGHTLLFSGKTDEALQCFLQIKDEKSKDEAILSTALAYSRTRNYREVINLLADKLNTSVHSRQQVILTDLLLAAYHYAGDTKQVADLIVKLDAERPGNPDILVVTAREHFRSGQRVEAIARYQKAVSQAEPGNQTIRITLELADAYYEAGEWAEAAEMYADWVDQSTDNPLTRRYLISLYNSGARDKAFELAKRLRNGGEAIPFISEIEANVLVVLEDYETALYLFEQLTRLEPEEISHRFSVVEIQQKLENFEAARAVIESINFDEVKDDADALMETAYLRQQLNIGGELHFAYQARQVGINDKKTHQDYIRLFMSHTEQESGDLDVASIEIDHFVELKNKRDEITIYHIVDRDDYDLTKGEIPVSDARATKLLGLKTGDTVVFDEGMPTEVHYEISAVKNKYVYAFQESIKKYNEWFGGTGAGFDGLMVMDVAGGDFSSLFRLIDSQKERDAFIINKFREGHLLLATLARLDGKSLFETWFSVIESSDLKIIVSSGQIEQLEKEIATVKRSREIVIDLSGLLTLQFLGLLDKLPVAFSRIVVTKSVNGTLKEWQSDFDKTGSFFTTIWEDRGGSFHRQLTQEEVENRRAFINEIVSFVKGHTEILSAKKVLTIPGEKLDEYHEFFGASLTSVLLANERHLPLYLDDFQLGQIGESLGWEINEVSIQAILLKFKNMGLISRGEYWAALKKLIVANYVYISIDSNALWWMCRDEGKRATPIIQKILMVNLGPWCNEKSAVIVGAKFIHHVCLEVSDISEKIKLIDLTLDAILQGRDKQRIITKLRSILSANLISSLNLRNLVLDRIHYRDN